VYLPPLVEKGVLVGEQERFLSSNVGLFADMHREFHSLLFRRFRRYSYATPQPQPPPIGDIFLTMARHHIRLRSFLRLSLSLTNRRLCASAEVVLWELPPVL
jgi:hypothetical protein